MKKQTCVFVMCCVLSGVLLQTAQAVQYRLVDLGKGPGFASFAKAINDNRQIVGTFFDGSFVSHAYYWENGVMTDLGAGYTVHDINNSGKIVAVTGTSGNYQGMYGDKNGLSVVSGTYALRSINNNDVAAGRNASGQAITYTPPGSISPLGSGDAEGINDAGIAVGVNGSQAVMYSGGSTTGLGTLGGSTSIALDINNNNQIIGHSFLSGNTTQHAFLYEGGSMSDLGTIGSDAGSWGYAINDAGMVVGESGAAMGSGRAFLYDNGTMYNLIDLVDFGESIESWTLLYAMGINSYGDIVGTGEVNGELHGYMLVAVPEPFSILLVGCSIGGLFLRRRTGRSE